MAAPTPPPGPSSKPSSRRKFIRNISIAGIGTAGIAVFLDKCTRVFEDESIDPTDSIAQAFRLTDHRSLLNLEYYFINCHYHDRKKKIIARYGPHENYMIVRLPQQHLAETNFTPTEAANLTYISAATYISGYSYLVFRILFPEDPFFTRLGTLENGEVTDVHMTRDKLLDWDDERKFRLVVRQDLTTSIFETQYITRTKEKPTSLPDNHYPFQQVPVDTARLHTNQPDQPYLDSLRNDSLRINKVPKVHGDPVTALELPWRLIISPKIPDSRRYRFKWDIHPTATKDAEQHLLWTATLSIAERTDDDYKALKKQELKEKNEEKNAGTVILDQAINQLEIMILGSPDYFSGPGYIPNELLDKVLPKTLHRDNLVELYIKLRLLAHTDKLVISPLGATVNFHIKNTEIEKGLKYGIEVIEWNQVISLGQDEKVEVATLFLEFEFGHKMVHIETTQRTLVKGVFALIRRAYLMPLDITKDYTLHNTQTNTGDKKDGIISRFGSPFKKITFIETKPKLLLPDTLVFSRDNLSYTDTTFAFEAIDWHDQHIFFNKKINALPIGAAIDSATTGPGIHQLIQNPAAQDAPANVADTEMMRFKEVSKIISDTTHHAGITALEVLLAKGKKLSENFERSINTIFAGLPVTRLDHIREKIEEAIAWSKNKSAPAPEVLYQNLIAKYVLIEGRLERSIQVLLDSWAQQELTICNNAAAFLARMKNLAQINNSLYTYLETTIGGDFNTQWEKLAAAKPLDDQDPFYQKCKEQAAKWKNQLLQQYSQLASIEQLITDYTALLPALKKDPLLEITNALLHKIITESPGIAAILQDIITIKTTLANVNNDINQLKDLIQIRIATFRDIDEAVKKIPNIIMLKRQQIGYALQQELEAAKTQAVDKVTQEVKKSLSALESEFIIFKGQLRATEEGIFDFFHEYAIMPEVQQARVYVSTLNRLINDEIPISINYARDYLDNQLKDLTFETKQNAAMVFAEVQAASRQEVGGLIRKLGEKMPGLNVELPIHYLTYLQNPKEAGTALMRELGYPQSDIDMVKQAAKDLVFIGQDVKNAIKTIEDLQQVDPKAYFRQLGAKLFGSIGLEDILGVGFDLPRVTELPDRLVYQFSTNRFQAAKLAFVAFKPDAVGTTPTQLDLFISQSLVKANEFTAYTRLNNFSIAVVIGGTEVVTVLFESFKITQAPGQSKKTDISISDIKMGGVLEFIAEIAKKFQAPGNGMLIKAGPRQLDLSFGITLPNISTPAFNIKNIQLHVGVTIPYDPGTVRPIVFTAGLNTPANKFLITAGIYGGRGHVQLRATPRGVELIDIGMEMGAYAGLDLGIGKGEVFLFFGIWFMCGRDPETGENMVKAVAYVLAAGSAVVLGFITIGVSVMISLTYIKRGQMSLMYGEAVVTYSVKIAFFKKEFSIRYYKEIAGSSEGNQSTGTNTQLAFIGGGHVRKQDGVADTGIEKKEFEEVFTSSSMLQQYIQCFA